MVLVEQGPWAGPIANEMRRLQDRLYGTLDAAIDGQLAEQFPESKGKQSLSNCTDTTCPGMKLPAFWRGSSEACFGCRIIEEHWKATCL
jgi:hypothetical protein